MKMEKLMRAVDEKLRIKELGPNLFVEIKTLQVPPPTIGLCLLDRCADVSECITNTQLHTYNQHTYMYA